jgi:mxaA protein
VRIFVLGLASLASALAAAAAPAISLSIVEPRGFGYFVGDVFQREIDVTVAEPYRLDKASVPAPGRLNYWLDLRAVDLTETGASGARHYRLRLDYQTFYVPLSPAPLTVPPFTLRASAQGESAVETEVPPFTFVMAPLREVAPEKPEEGPSGYLKPDAVPRPLGTLNARIALGIGGAISALALLLLAHHYAWWPFRARAERPFTQAARAIDKQLAQDAGLAAYRAGLLDLHRAFDKAAGHRLLAEDVPDFLASHGEFRPLKEDITRFFATSRQVFFANDLEGAARAMPFEAVASFGARLGAAELSAA